MAPEKPADPDLAATWYRDRLAWRAHVADGAVVLPLGHGVVAFDVPGDRRFTLRKMLECNDMCTPVLLVGRPEPRAVFFAEADDVVFGQFQMPVGVRYLTVPTCLRLPLLVTTTADDVKWFRAPDPARRWLFSANAVLAAINTATPPLLRSRAHVARPLRDPHRYAHRMTVHPTAEPRPHRQ